MTQQVHDVCTEWLCLCCLCFTLKGPLFCPWDAREVGTVVKVCVLGHLCSLANKLKLEFVLLFILFYLFIYLFILRSPAISLGSPLLGEIVEYVTVFLIQPLR